MGTAESGGKRENERSGAGELHYEEEMGRTKGQGKLWEMLSEESGGKKRGWNWW